MRMRGRFIWIVAAALFTAACGSADAARSESERFSARLVNTSGSIDQAAARFLEALALADARRIRSLALTREEFDAVVWPALPGSEPGSGLTPDFVWGMYAPRNTSALRRLLARHGGRRYELEAVEFTAPVRDYGSYRIHPESRLAVRGPSGEATTLRLFGSVIEQDGRFKIYGFVTD